MIDIETAKGYMRDLENDAHWLTEYAQDKEDRQRLIYMTVTMNRARWLIGELIGELKPQQTDCAWAAPDAPRTVPLYPMKGGEETNEDNSR